jgi:glutathione synthase/RimK-type ligase-like ATP-grasp enzyme
MDPPLLTHTSLPSRPAPVALASCAAVVGRVPDDLAVIAALRRHGIDATHAAWDDPTVDWSAFGLVVVRSTWDYLDRREAFLAWAHQLPAVLNPAPVLDWSTDKRYLGELAAAGVPVIPTRFLSPGEDFEPPPVPFVLKPAVGCDARGVGRYGAGEVARAREDCRRLHQGGQTVLVQPYLPGTEASGETDLVFLGGTYSHAIRRPTALPGVGQPGHGSAKAAHAHEATPAERRLAELALARVPGGAADLLYARVDVVPGPDGPLVLEVELAEPTLFLVPTPGGVERFATAISARTPR